ncbi:MAG: hypothetical protein WCF84_16775 [Anaerolineae bacterium]
MSQRAHWLVQRASLALLLVSVLFALIACGSSAPAAAPTTPPQPTTAAAKPTTASASNPLDNQPPLTTFGSGGEAAPGTATANVQIPTVPATGTRVADSGFRPETDGLTFENYVNSPGIVNMSAEDMQKVYGDAVCATKTDGKCVLTPPAQQWMDQQNAAMNGGHCYGMSVTALRLWAGQAQTADLGGSSVAGLTLTGNEKLQRDIATSWVYQRFDSIRAQALVGTPNGILKFLEDLLKQGKSAKETYTIGFFKIEGGGGHAVTPYAIEDRGNGMFALMVWDNNFPKAPREMIFDTTKNMWFYSAATNPTEPAGLYYGTADSKSLMLFPTTPGLTAQSCPFCAGTTGRVGGVAQAKLQYNQVYLEGDPKNHPHLLFTTDDGKRFGYTSDGKFVTEIPGAQIERDLVHWNASPDTWGESDEPTYEIPTGIKFTLTIDASNLKQESTSNVIMIGPGYDIGVDGVKLAAGQKDTLAVSPQGDQLSYTTQGKEAPTLVFGVEHKGADYSFEVAGVDLQGGDTLTAALDYAKGALTINAKGVKQTGQYGLTMHRYDDKGDQSFGNDKIELAAGATALLEFGKWAGKGSTLELQISSHSDGTIDQTLELTSTK